MRFVLHVAALCSLLACGGNLAAAPLSLPVQGEVTEIVTTWKDGIHQNDQLSRITDPAQIEAALEFIGSLNADGRKPLRTFLSPQYVARFLHGDAEVLIIFVGTNWMGGRDGSTAKDKNHMRRISAQQHQQFLAIFLVQ